MSIPKCIVAGCEQPASYVKQNKNGGYTYRHTCSKHHKVTLAVTKLHYCENRDGHLGFGSCTATIVGSEQLHIDHVDGNRYNVSPSNLRTYCANCHATKTRRSGDHLNRYEKVAVKTTFDSIFSIGE
jgi:hypothetical protein